MTSRELEEIACECESTASSLAALPVSTSPVMQSATRLAVANGYALADLARMMARKAARQEAARWWKPWTWFA